MAQQHIDFGTFPNDPAADPLRAAFEKIQQNFNELYNAQLATGVERLTTGAGLTQNRQTGNVTIVANIPNITVQTSSNLLVGVGVASGNSATISSYSTPIVLNLSNSISTGNANVTNIRVSNITITNSIGSSMIPNVDDSYSLGTSSYRWKDASISDSITLGTSAVMTANGQSIVATTFEANSSVVTGNILLNGATGVANIPTANIPTLLVSNLTASNNISASGNLSVTGNASVSGNTTVSGRTTTGTLTSTGNANVGNLGTGGLIVATGNITGGNLVTGGVLNVTGNATTGNLLSGGVVTATGNINGGNIITSGLVSATGNINGGNLVTPGNAVVTGTVTGGNVTAGNIVKAQTGTIIANATVGNILTVANLIVANTINANLDINTVNLTSTGNLLASGNISLTGNTTASNVTVTGKLTAANGVVTSNLSIGNADISGSTKTGTLNVTANANAGNLGVSGVIVSTGNITGGNLITGGVLTATGNVTGGNLITGGVLSVTGNANVGNLGTAGLIVATGNVTGGNLVTGGTLSVTGNATANNITVTNLITGATGNFTTVNISSNLSVGNLSTPGTVNAATQVLTPLVRVSNANITGDVDNTIVVSNIRAGGNANIVGSAKVNGVLTVVGNTTASNIFATAVSASNISATNVSATNVSVSTNLTTNNFSANYVVGNLLPSSNITYNLGSPTNRWKDLYLSGNTLSFPTATLGDSGDGSLVADNFVINDVLDAGGTIIDDGGVSLLGTGAISFTNSPTTLSPTTLSIGGVGATSAVSLNFANNMLQSDKAIAAPVINVTNYITVQQINLGNDAKIVGNSGKVVVNSLVSQNDIVASTLTSDSIKSPTISLSGVTIGSDGSKILMPSMSIAGQGSFDSLVVTKAADVGSLTATTVDAKITDPDQPFITQLPNLKEVTVDVLNVNSLDVAENATVQGTVSAGTLASDKVTTITNNTTVVLPAPGASGSFIFNDGGNAAAVPGMSFDKTSQLMSLSGSIQSGNLTSTGILAVTSNANIGGSANVGSLVSRGAAAIQGNLSAGNITTKAIDGTIITISGNVSGANLISTGVIKAPTSDINKLFANEGSVSGNHFIGGFANIQGGALIKGDANIIGNLAGLTQITTAGLANLASALVVGNTSLQGKLDGANAAFTGNVTVGNFSLGSLNITKTGIDAAALSIKGGTFTATLFTGNGASITNINGANVSKVGNSGYADLATAASEAYKVTGANVTGVVANAAFSDTAKKATTATTADLANAIQLGSYANITGVGTLGALTVTNKISAANFSGDGSLLTNLDGTTVTGTVARAKQVTENAQANITSVGTLASLEANGNIKINTGSFIGNGSGLTSINGANVSIVANANYAAYSPGSGIQGQTGMWTSVNRPGPYRLYRNDVDDAYSVQTYYNSSSNRWRLQGYYSNNAAHNGVEVSYADTSGSVSGVTLQTGLGTGSSPQFNIIGVGVAPVLTGAGAWTAGEIRATNNITAYASSDRRLKQDIRNIDNALNKMHSLNGILFNWTQEYIDSRGGEDDMFVRRKDTGVIAQEVEQVLPEIVATRPDGYKAVQYEKMVGLFIEAIKELDDKVESIKKHLGL